MSSAKWIRIKFQQLEIRHLNPTVQAYYSVTFNQKLYFTSVFDDELTLEIKNLMIVPLEGLTADFISLQRWQSHLIVFDHEIFLSELKTKPIIKKKIQPRKSQILTLTIQLCDQKDIILCKSLIPKTSQQYLVLQNIRLKDQQASKRGDYGACYFKITTSMNQYDIPVQNGNCLIYLPQTFQISQYKNAKCFSSSKSFTFQQINQETQEIILYTESNQYAGKVTFNTIWIIDVSQPLPLHYLLLHSLEILIYDLELKFDLPNDFVGSKLKIYSNNKVFEFNDELGNTKIIKFKKAAWIVCKMAHDHISIKIQRNDQIISRLQILAEQLNYCQLFKKKQKLMDASNPLKPLGQIKFNIQKTKGGINPQHGDFWKQCLKKKSTGSILVEQLSICYDEDEPTSIFLKTQAQRKSLAKLLNINFFEQEPFIYHNPLTLNPKPEETIYFMIKGQSINPNSEDFIGIAVLNMGEISLGMHPYEIDFYKNQEKLGSINCLITKFQPLTFVKSVFQPQKEPQCKLIEAKLSINTLTLTPYFFSYKYDRQNEVLGIVQVNRVKKVLILQPTFQELSFVPSTTSDNLLFSVEVEEILKVKVTIMIGDGMMQEIYGAINLSIKMDELRQNLQLTRKDLFFTNFAETIVGRCNLVLNLQNQQTKRIEKKKSKQKLPFQSSRNRSSNSKKDKQRKSISVMQMLTPQYQQIKAIKNLLPAKKHALKDNTGISYSIDKKNTPDSKQISKYEEKQSLKLPLIKEKKIKESFHDLLLSMNVRKRTIAGYDYNRNQQEDKTMRDYLNNIPESNTGKNKHKPIDYQNLRDSNPNIDRNFDLLFPPKKSQTKQQQIKNQLSKYEQKLRGLKSVLNEISNDIDPIEPSVKQNNTERFSKNDETNNFEMAGNEFL